MSSKTKIVVFHMKELIYTAIFVGLAILFIILMVCMFDKKGDDKKTKETMKYQAGVYTSSILFNDNVLDVEVAVDEKKIKSISLVNLDESTATMYPLVANGHWKVCPSRSIRNSRWKTLHIARKINTPVWS